MIRRTLMYTRTLSVFLMSSYLWKNEKIHPIIMKKKVNWKASVLRCQVDIRGKVVIMWSCCVALLAVYILFWWLNKLKTKEKYWDNKMTGCICVWRVWKVQFYVLTLCGYCLATQSLGNNRSKGERWIW